MIRAIEVRRRYMMSIVPVCVFQASVISIVLDNLLLVDPEIVSIVELSIGQVNQFVDMLSTEWSFTVMRCDRRAHLLKDHHVVLRHD